MHNILFATIHKDAVIPAKRDEDSDYDLFPAFDDKMMIIPPFTTVNIPTGLISAFDKDLGVKYEERGSNSKWRGIIQSGVIDSGYRGEWLVPVYNGNSVPVYIDKSVTDYVFSNSCIRVPYTKAICQFNIREIPEVTVTTASADAIRSIASERGTGAFGSTDR